MYKFLAKQHPLKSLKQIITPFLTWPHTPGSACALHVTQFWDPSPSGVPGVDSTDSLSVLPHATHLRSYSCEIQPLGFVGIFVSVF